MTARNRFPRCLVFILVLAAFFHIQGTVCIAAEDGAEGKRVRGALAQEARALGFLSTDEGNIGNLTFLNVQAADMEMERRFSILQAKIGFVLIFDMEPNVENLVKTIRRPVGHNVGGRGCFAALKVLVALPDQEVRDVPVEDIEHCFRIHEDWLVRVSCIELMVKIDPKRGYAMADDFIDNDNVCLRAKVSLALSLAQYGYLGSYFIMEEALGSLDPVVRANIPALVSFFKDNDGKPAHNREINTGKLLADALSKVGTVQEQLSAMKTRMEAGKDK
jgi:hypothetical protein